MGRSLVHISDPPAPTLAERDERLRASPETGLVLSSVRPDLVELDESVGWATRYNLHNRPDNAQEWFELYLLEALTRPAVEPAVELDPRVAQRGDACESRYR